jgi:uncharacterized protein YegP (UPF0339 family)
MRPSELREKLSAGLLDFAWDQWGQMGVLSSPRRLSSWAQDPEALLIFTLEVGRDDPRLFDAVLDWLLVNEALVSVRRLRAMCRDDDDRRLLDATLAWLAGSCPRARFSQSTPEQAPASEPLFRGVTSPIREPDPYFQQFGLDRRRLDLSGTKAQPPPLRAPVSLAFRLRLTLGVGARAEVVRHLLTADAPVAVGSLVASAGFARRNVQEALSALQAADMVTATELGGAPGYAVDAEAWRALLRIDPSDMPGYRPWPQLLGALRTVLRWLQRPDLDTLSEYLLSSQAEDLLEAVRPDFDRAAVPVPSPAGVVGWPDLEALVEQALNRLAQGPWRLSGLRLPGAQTHRDPAGNHRWTLWTSEGRRAAISGPAFATVSDLRQAFKSFIEEAHRLRFDIYSDGIGVYRWRAIAPDGEVVALAGESFESAEAAHEAVDRLEHLASAVALAP